MENVFDTKRKIDHIYDFQMLTVAYLRLSQEDGDGESSSISNQRKIITRFAEERGFTIAEFYIDDGYSGFTMDRPAFNKLKHDLNTDKVHTIIFKDLSRLSRNNAKTQTFLESIQEAGKRVLTVYEGYDTLDPRTHKMVGIYGWVNEDCVRDTSMKVKDAINTLQKEGTVINNIPYGYIKDPINKKQYYIDETTAPYVKKIFDMYINGMGINAIAHKLNEEKVPTARTIRKQRIESRGETTKFKTTLWVASVIKDILKNDFYIGTVTLKKTQGRTIRGKRTRTNPDQQYIFENAHEPLIDKDTFQLAQNITLQRKKTPYRGTKVERPNIFSGMLQCADCGRIMTSGSRSQNTRYVCTSYNKYGTNICSSHAVMEYQIIDSLILFLKDCRTQLIKLLDNLNDIVKREFNKQGDAISLQKDLERVKQEIKVLMEQKMRETIANPSMKQFIDEMYNETLGDKYRMIEYLEKQINDVLNIEKKEVELKNNFKSALNLFDEIINTKQLTKKQALILIDKIIVYEDSTLDIYLKGDLHELCSNKINIVASLQDKLDKSTTDYILSNKEYITMCGAWKYAKNNGISIGYVKFSGYFNKFIRDNILTKIAAPSKGYKYISTDEALKTYTCYNNVVEFKGWYTYNNVTLEILFAINDLGASYSRMYKKLLF